MVNRSAYSPLINSLLSTRRSVLSSEIDLSSFRYCLLPTKVVHNGRILVTKLCSIVLCISTRVGSSYAKSIFFTLFSCICMSKMGKNPPPLFLVFLFLFILHRLCGDISWISNVYTFDCKEAQSKCFFAHSIVQKLSS